MRTPNFQPEPGANSQMNPMFGSWELEMHARGLQRVEVGSSS
jgi:hypothetical protein